MIPPVYVINMDESSDRLESMKEQCKRINIDIIRQVALDGRDINLSDFTQYDDNATRRFMGRSLAGGEIGCYMSHLSCAAQILKDGHDNAVVLEDDAKIGSDFLSALPEIIFWLNENRPDWHLVHLGPNRMKISTHLGKIGSGRDFSILAAHYFPMQTHALLWSRRGAEDFVRSLSQVKMPVDNAIREWLVRSGRGFAVWPPLVTQSDQASKIDSSNYKRKFTDRTWNYGYLKQRRLIVNKLIARTKKLESHFRK